MVIKCLYCKNEPDDKGVTFHPEGCPQVDRQKTRGALREIQEEADKEEREKVDHPPHYTFGKFEVIDVIEDWNLGIHEANTVKYIARAKHKGEELQDLKKARWYLDRKIQQLEKPD